MKLNSSLFSIWKLLVGYAWTSIVERHCALHQDKERLGIVGPKSSDLCKSSMVKRGAPLPPPMESWSIVVNVAGKTSHSEHCHMPARPGKEGNIQLAICIVLMNDLSNIIIILILAAAPRATILLLQKKQVVQRRMLVVVIVVAAG
jgi:hypothetical protein